MARPAKQTIEPQVEVLVDDEMVLMSVAADTEDGSRQRRHGRSGVVRRAHSAGHVSGASIQDFLALPARARVSVRYRGATDGVQGFMSLRKL